MAFLRPCEINHSQRATYLQSAGPGGNATHELDDLPVLGGVGNKSVMQNVLNGKL